MRQGIRRAAAPWIEPDRSAEDEQSLEEPHQHGLVPHQIDRTDRRVKDEQVERTIANNLIGDLTIARVGVLSLWKVRHCRQFA
jgi:hypothetical protein